jgi:hypothetical protein
VSDKKTFDNDVITKLYVVDKKSLKDCSKILNTSHITLSLWMRQNKIPIDLHRKHSNVEFTFSKNENEIIDGCLLGDGHITKPKGKSCQFSYCSSKFEHVNFVYKKLKRLMVLGCRNGPIKHRTKDKRTKKYYTSYKIKTQNNIAFYKLRIRWYPNNIKIVPSDVKLTPQSILFWYIGDGGIINGKRCQYIKISTHCFTLTEVEFLKSTLSEFNPKIYGKKQPVIYIPHNRIQKFLDYIGECPVLCYDCKWKFKPYKYKIYER